MLRNFSGGIVTSKAPDELEANESPRGRNSALYLVAGDKALVQKRKGASVSNATPVSGSPKILGQYAYRKFDTAGNYTLYHLLVSNNGRLDVLSGGAAAAADGSAPTPFTAGDYLPDFTASNNLAFMVNANGDKKKFNGTNVQNFGITRPTVGTMAIAAGAAGLHNGTYEARVTYYNANTGHESSISDTTSATVTVALKQLSWTNIPVSSDSQVTARRLYLRNTATMSQFYLAGTVSDNVTTTATTNLADTSLVTLGPDTAENNPPPANVKYLATHLSRVWTSDGIDLFYSKADFPEAFDPDASETVNANDSDQITAIHAAHEILVVFKRTSMYGLFGDEPDSWTIRQISADVGAVSHRSIITVEGVTYWWSLKGPMAWDGTGLPRAIGTPLIQPTISTDSVEYSQFGNLCTSADQVNQRVMFACAASGQTRNNIMLPFNYRLGVWESDQWNPFDVCSMAIVEDTNKVPWVMVGSYSGQVFKWWAASNDAVPDGTTRSGTVTSNTGTTLTDTTAAFANTGGKLVDRYVYILDPTLTNIQRVRITSNTATVLTLDATVGITGTVTGYSYVVGGPQFEFDTPWRDSNLPFHKKRFEYLYTEAYSNATNITLNFSLYSNYDVTNPIRTGSVTTASNSAIWDTSLWDGSALWGLAASVQRRTRVGRTGRYWRVRYSNYQPDQDIVLTKVSMRSELLTDRS